MMKTYEFRVTVDAEGEPPAELVRREVDTALLAHLGNIPFGDSEEYEVFTWTVDIQDPETSVTYGEDDDRRSVLDIMKWRYRDGSRELGGYRLLRSEFLDESDTFGRQETARLWLDDITMMLAFSVPCGCVTAIHDLYENGDISEDDIRVFGEVLRRYVRLTG